MGRDEKLLVITMEEAGELIRGCSKILRRGVDEKNLLNLREEMADVQACIHLLLEDYALPDRACEPTFHAERTSAKFKKIAGEIDGA